MIGLGTLRRVAGEIRRDVAAAHDRDPAARGVSSVEILAGWPGVHALLGHRVAHAMHHAGVPFVPRMLSTATRSATGIEIHPAARIGDGLFIFKSASAGNLSSSEPEAGRGARPAAARGRRR